MKKVEFGVVNWIEEQKEWIADYMERKFRWERFFKGKNGRETYYYRTMEENELQNGKGSGEKSSVYGGGS